MAEAHLLAHSRHEDRVLDDALPRGQLLLLHCEKRVGVQPRPRLVGRRHAVLRVERRQLRRLLQARRLRRLQSQRLSRALERDTRMEFECRGIGWEDWSEVKRSGGSTTHQSTSTQGSSVA